MIIPNLVNGEGQLTLAVPNPSYWCSTAAEYYINIPGYGTDVACVWGDSSTPVGNWAPYVAGANQASDGSTYVMVGINPIYCCENNAFKGADPGFAIRIDCPSGNCNGMPCECNPSTMGVNKCTGGSVGAGGAEFCIVTVPDGESANLVIFPTTNGSLISTSAISSEGGPAVVVPPPGPAIKLAPGPAPSSSGYHAPPSPHSSKSTSDPTTATSSYWSSHTTSVAAEDSDPPKDTDISESDEGSDHQDSVQANNGTSSDPTIHSTAALSSSSLAATSAPVLQVTSGSDRAIRISTLLCLLCFIVLAI
jgi:hypothetical protein